MATQVGFQLESSLASKHLTDSQFIKGTYVVVDTLAERNALPIYPTVSNDGVIVTGSLVYVSGENKTYRYNGAGWDEVSIGPAQDLSGYVKLAEAQTITGAKTFSEHPILSNNIFIKGVKTDGSTIIPLIGVDNNNRTVVGSAGTTMILSSFDNVLPDNDNAKSLGTSSARWKDIYLSGQIKNGTNSWTMPSSSGTLALTSEIPSAPGTLNTMATTPQAVAASESLAGTITLHSVAKTGNADTTDDYHFTAYGYNYKGYVQITFSRSPKGTITTAQRNAMTISDTAIGDVYIISDDNNRKWVHYKNTNNTPTWSRCVSPQQDWEELENNDGFIYIKLQSEEAYASSFVDFLIQGSYDNICGSTEIREYCRATNKYYINSVSYNGNKLVGIYQPGANTNLWYLKFAKFVGSYTALPGTYSGFINIWMNQNITSAEIIQPSNANYSTVAGYSYAAVPEWGISGTGGAIFNKINGVTVGTSPKFTDTLNTTGTVNKESTKLFLVGAETQGDNPTTKSNSKVYIGTDNQLYSNGSKLNHVTTVTTTGSESVTIEGSTLNVVTRDTTQTISGAKSFSNDITFDNNKGVYGKDSNNTTVSLLRLSTGNNLIIGNSSISGNTIFNTTARPDSTLTNAIDLGTQSYKWRNIYLGGTLRDGNNSNYGLALPSTTNWTANKTIATLDDIPSATVDTWRPIQVDGVEKLGSANTTGALNFIHQIAYGGSTVTLGNVLFDYSPNNGLYGNVYGQDIYASYADNTKLIDSSGKLPVSLLPDAILGQVIYGGPVNASGIVSISSLLRAKLGLASTVTQIKVINSATDNTSASPKEYGYATLEGVYFIASANGTVVGQTLEKGDWLIANGTEWSRIDNTDAVTGVKGNAETDYRIGNVNITPANIGVSLTTTAGSESVTVGSSSLNVVTRNTAQTIDGSSGKLKTFVGELQMKSSAASASAANDVNGFRFFSSTGTLLGHIGTNDNKAIGFYATTLYYRPAMAADGSVDVTKGITMDTDGMYPGSVSMPLGKQASPWGELFVNKITGVDATVNGSTRVSSIDVNTANVAATVSAKKLTITDTQMANHIEFQRNGWNYIVASGGNNAVFGFVAGGQNASGATTTFTVAKDKIFPGYSTNTIDLGGAPSDGGSYPGNFKDLYLYGKINTRYYENNTWKTYERVLPSKSGTFAMLDDISNTDDKTAQTAVSTNSSFPILFKNTADASFETAGTKFDSLSKFKYNPSTHVLNVHNITGVQVSEGVQTPVSSSITMDDATFTNLTVTSINNDSSFVLTDTLNTVGATDITNTVAYLVGTITHGTASAQSYVSTNSYIGSDNCLYSNGAKVLTTMYYRPIKVDGTQILANTSSTALDLVAGSAVTLTNNSGAVTINVDVPQVVRYI